ncbi:MAG: hypothetical protein ACLFMT_04370 [Halobacteriales archaeon]
MPSDSEFDSALSTVERFAADVSGEVVGEVEGESDDGVVVSGFAVDQGGTVYRVYGSGDWRYFRVEARYEAVAEVAGTLRASGASPEERERMASLEDLSEDDLERAFEHMRSSWREMSGDERGGFAAALTRALAREAVGYSVYDREGVPVGVEVSRRIYPFDEGFDRRRYDDAVMTVVDVLLPARDHVRRLYDVGRAVQGGSVDSDVDRAFM